MALAVCASAYGCGAFTTDSARDVRVGKNGKGPPVTQVEVQQDVQRFASQFIDRMNQAFTPLAEEGEPHRREIALRLGVAYLSSALDIASGPYPEINLVDMIVFMKLSGDALETHWIPVTFGDEGRELLKAFRQSETQIWEISDKVRVLIGLPMAGISKPIFFYSILIGTIRCLRSWETTSWRSLSRGR